jgi:hypothetical protein
MFDHQYREIAARLARIERLLSLVVGYEQIEGELTMATKDQVNKLVKDVSDTRGQVDSIKTAWDGYKSAMETEIASLKDAINGADVDDPDVNAALESLENTNNELGGVRDQIANGVQANAPAQAQPNTLGNQPQPAPSQPQPGAANTSSGAPVATQPADQTGPAGGQ